MAFVKTLSLDRVQQLVVVIIFLFRLVGDARTWYYRNVHTLQMRWLPPDLVLGDEEEDEESEEEDEEDDDLDEMDVTQSFSCWVPAHAGEGTAPQARPS